MWRNTFGSPFNNKELSKNKSRIQQYANLTPTSWFHLEVFYKTWNQSQTSLAKPSLFLLLGLQSQFHLHPNPLQSHHHMAKHPKMLRSPVNLFCWRKLLWEWGLACLGTALAWTLHYVDVFEQPTTGISHHRKHKCYWTNCINSSNEKPTLKNKKKSKSP